MAVTRHEARGNAREPDGGTPGRSAWYAQEQMLGWIWRIRGVGLMPVFGALNAGFDRAKISEAEIRAMLSLEHRNRKKGSGYENTIGDGCERG